MRLPEFERVVADELGNDPDDLPLILAKSDSGARTSALDCETVEEEPGGRVRFTLALRRGTEPVMAEVTADIVRMAEVRSSNGKRSVRYVVATPVQIGATSFLTEFSLVRRKRMICRILLGRTAMAGRFYVDSGREFLLTDRDPDNASP